MGPDSKESWGHRVRVDHVLCLHCWCSSLKLRAQGLFLVDVWPQQETPVLFIIFTHTISSYSQWPEGVQFGIHGSSFPLFTDDVVLLASLSQPGWDKNQYLKVWGHNSWLGRGGLPFMVWFERSYLKWMSTSIYCSSVCLVHCTCESDSRIYAVSSIMNLWVEPP